MRHRLVIARWNEDVSWARAYPHVIYDKGGASLDATGLDVIRLSENPPHREAHTYLWHIIHNYHDLDDFTTFCQGNPFPHANDWEHEWCIEKDFAWVGHWLTTDDRFGKPNHPVDIPIGAAYEAVFGRPAPNRYEFTAGAQFVASREMIRSRPFVFWKYVQSLNYDPQFAGDNIIGVHERLWWSFFYEPL